jgi:hypothetical protein
VVLIVLLGVFPRPLLTLVDGSVRTLQRTASAAAPGVRSGDALSRFDARDVKVPRRETAR